MPEEPHFCPEGFIEPMDVQHALFGATMLHHFARLAPVLDSANIYHLLAGFGVFAVDRDRVRPTLMADVFRLYRETLPATRLDLDTESPAFGEKSRQLEALALAGESGAYLFLVNRGDSAALTASIDPALGRLTGGIQLIGSGLSAEEAARVTPAVDGNRVVLPPLSLTRLHLE